MQQSPVILGQGQGSLTEAPRISLFERIISQCDKNGRRIRSPLCNSVMLEVQYRMHPVISQLSNEVANRLVRDCISPALTESAFYHQTNPSYVSEYPCTDNFEKYRRPVVWIDPYALPVTAFEQDLENINVVNYGSSREIACIKKLIGILLQRKDAGIKDIVIITPYNEQRSLLQENMPEVVRRNAVLSEAMGTISVSTVSAIQGDDRNCIIVSACRNRLHKGSSLGIVGDPRALYVAITRAKAVLYIVGDADYLSSNSKDWNLVVQFCLEDK